MKKIFLAVATALAMFSCSQKEPVTVTITNPLSIDRNGEMVEISMAEITGKLQLPDTAQVIVLDENGLEVPYQITYDDMLIFPASVKGDASAVYTIAEGTPQPVDVLLAGVNIPNVWMMWHGRMTVPLIVHTVLLCRRRASVPLVMTSGPRMYPNRWWKIVMTVI